MFTHLRPAVLIAFLLGASLGCDQKKTTSVDTPGVEVDAPAPSVEPEVPAMTTIVFALSPGAGDGEELSAFLTKELGMKTEVVAPGNYSTIVEALQADEAQIALLPAWPYMASHHKADMEVMLVEQNDGKTEYQSQWLVLAKNKIKTLKDLKGKSIVFTEPTSAAGFLYPTASLFEAEVITASDDPAMTFKSILMSGGEKGSLTLLTQGKVDAVAVREDAPATYLTEDEQKTIRVIHSKGPVPADCIAVRGTLSADLKDRIKAALLKLNAPENAKILKDVFGADALVEVPHFKYTETLQSVIDIVEADFPL